MQPTTHTSTNVVDFVVHKANGLKGLVDTGLETLPDQYIQPPEERLDPTQVGSQEFIPIIDVSNWDDPKVADLICEAASKLGFFQIVNHGVPLEVLDNVKDAVRGFFGLPSEERSKYWVGKSVSDTVYLTTSFSPLTEKVLEWRDYLAFHYKPEDEEASALWPPVCKDQLLDYMKRAELIIKKLLELLLKRLDVKHIDKAKEHALMGSLGISFNYYPPCPNPDFVAGVGRHSDISSITILLQDNVGGLYVRATDGNTWIHVPPIEGALVINIGDALQIMSNDRYKSIEHRSVANRSKSRVSIPIFVNPAPDALVGPLPEVLEGGETPIYKQVQYSDYFEHFFSKGHDGKNAINFAKI